MDDLMSAALALCGSDYSDYEEGERQLRRERDDEALRDVLAESVSSDVGALRLALAQIVVEERGALIYAGYCHCSTSGKGCSGDDILDTHGDGVPCM